MSSPLPPRVERLIGAIGPLDAAAMAEAARRLDRLTKPPGSLGRLEGLATRLAGITGVPAPTFRRRVIAIFAGDHGVTAQGVSAYPSTVTAGMVANFLGGGAAINALAGLASAEVIVLDVGVATPIPAPPVVPGEVRARLVSAPVRLGTRDLSLGPAMTRVETLAAMEAGLALADELSAQPDVIVGVGEMGIGNTTAASAVVSALTARSVRSVTGRGAGADDATFERKVRIIEDALRLHRPEPGDPIGALASVGGLEIAALSGLIIGAAAARIPVVLDGFITGAAALVAARLSPLLPDRLIAGHLSEEPGHAVVLSELGLTPLLDLGLRLGEGSGAALALLLVEAVCRIRDRMATFDSAGIDGPLAD